MDLYIFFNVIFLYLSGTSASIVLTQKNEEIAQVGKSIELGCEVSGYNINDHHMQWIRQVTGGNLIWISAFRTGYTTYIADSFKGRVTPSTSGSTALLKIDRLTESDTAKYYCARGMGTGYFDIWGQGTLVTVTSDEIIHPQVYPLIPYHQKNKEDITFGCLALKYLPNPVSVVWNTSSGVALSGERNMQFPLSGDPLRYSLVSLMTVSSSQWDSNTYICDVGHFSSIIQITLLTPIPPPSPTVHILQETCLRNTDDQVELTCQAYNLTSKDAKIRWFFNDKERVLQQDLHYLEISNLYALHSTVGISLAEWNNGIRVKCQVTDTKTSNSSEATARTCSDIANCLGIEVIMVPPTIENLYVQKQAPIACTAYNLKQPTGFSFAFTYPGAPATVNSQTEDIQLNLNGTYSVTSILIVTPETWQSNTEFTCIFSFSELTKPIIRTISKKTETKLIIPGIAVFPPTPEDIAKDELCIITCIAYGFYPEGIYMGWVDEENMEISKDQHVNSQPKRNDRNRSYSATSLLSIPCREWKEGKRCGCLVGHEAIPMKFSKKDIDIQSGKPSKVNVSVVLSDTDMICY